MNPWEHQQVALCCSQSESSPLHCLQLSSYHADCDSPWTVQYYHQVKQTLHKGWSSFIPVVYSPLFPPPPQSLLYTHSDTLLWLAFQNSVYGMKFSSSLLALSCPGHQKASGAGSTQCLVSWLHVQWNGFNEILFYFIYSLKVYLLYMSTL